MIDVPQEFFLQDIANSGRLIELARFSEKSKNFRAQVSSVFAEMITDVRHTNVTQEALTAATAGKLTRSGQRQVASHELSGSFDRPVRFTPLEVTSPKKEVTTPPVRICAYLHNSPLNSIHDATMGISLEYLDSILSLANTESMSSLLPNVRVPEVELVTVIATETAKGMYGEVLTLSQLKLAELQQYRQEQHSPQEIINRFIELAHNSPLPEKTDFLDASGDLVMQSFFDMVQGTREEALLPLVFFGLPVDLDEMEKWRRNNKKNKFHDRYNQLLSNFSLPFVYQPLYEYYKPLFATSHIKRDIPSLSVPS